MSEETQNDVDIDIITSVTEFVKLSEAINDPALDEALAYVVKLIEKPDVPPSAAVRTIVKLEALSAKFAFAQTFYKTFGKSGTEERYKKDVYYTARDAIERLVDALKYIVRVAEARRNYG
jgi:hypothetical protein